MMTYDELIQHLTAWAQATPDVRAALILGSRARTDHPADEWSDLDIMAIAYGIDQFIESSSWAAEIAPLWLTFIERAGANWERRTLYEGGLDVDVMFVPAEWLEQPDITLPPDFANIAWRGVRVLVDKDGKLARVLAVTLPDIQLEPKPSERDFINAVSDFWYHTLWSVKHLRRSELWWAKSCVDSYLKAHLLRMLQWHARATRGDATDTWLGRFLEEWADPRAVAQLRDAFARYDAHDIARALRVTMALYRWLEDETAAAWSYAVPRAGEDRAAARALSLLEETFST